MLMVFGALNKPAMRKVPGSQSKLMIFKKIKCENMPSYKTSCFDTFNVYCAQISQQEH